MPAHSLDKVGDGHVPLDFWVEGRLGKVGGFQSSQQTQVVMPCQPVERDQFRRRGIQIVQIASPSILIERRDKGLVVGQHLSQSISIDDLDIRKVTEDSSTHHLSGEGL